MTKKIENYNVSMYLHIMTQGINKEKIFYKEKYKKRYLHYLKEEKEKYGVTVLSYAIMNNHAHLLMFCKDRKDITKYMTVVNCKYAKYYNKDNERVGYVFRDRYKYKLITNQKYLYNVLTYIHFNPIKDGYVSLPEEYEYSSYKEFVRKEKSKEEIDLIFHTQEYIEIFQQIHNDYKEKVNYQIMKEIALEGINENPQDIIGEFLKNHNINSVNEVKKDKNLLVELVKLLKSATTLKNIEICKILNLGKNRISILIKQMNS